MTTDRTPQETIKALGDLVLRLASPRNYKRALVSVDSRPKFVVPGDVWVYMTEDEAEIVGELLEAQAADIQARRS